MYIPRFVINNNTSRKLVVCVCELGWRRYDDACVHVCDERGIKMRRLRRRVSEKKARRRAMREERKIKKIEKEKIS
jgi:hypothetical protein